MHDSFISGFVFLLFNTSFLLMCGLFYMCLLLFVALHQAHLPPQAHRRLVPGSIQNTQRPWKSAIGTIWRSSNLCLVH